MLTLFIIGEDMKMLRFRFDQNCTTKNKFELLEVEGAGIRKSGQKGFK